MLFGILCLVLLSPLGLGMANNAELCKPWKIPVHTDHPDHNYRPYFVERHRCHGGCGNVSPQRCRCEAVKTVDIKVHLFHPLLGKIDKMVKDHTECASMCLPQLKKRCQDGNHGWDESTCACNCQALPQGKQCNAKQVWNKEHCQCDCKPATCNNGMIWNKNTCECECNVAAFTTCSKLGRPTNLKTCKCDNLSPVVGQVGSAKTNTNETKLLVALVVLALVLGILFIIELFLMCNKKGFIYGLGSICHNKPVEVPFTSNGDNVETRSIIMDNDNNQPDGKANGDYNQKMYVDNRDPETCL